tara:strand:- start:233 stop:1243 length:1011 start_codon:yes stop_codon:yes gene_type:complete
MKNKINLGIIGLGRFGINYLRTLNELDNANIKWICSGRRETLDSAAAKVELKSEVNKTTNYKDILQDKEVDAVAIVTPGSTHHRIAKDALLADKHVLVEKPFCLNSKDAEELVKISLEKNKVLMVGHLHLFNPGIQKIKEDIKAGLFGKMKYVHIIHTGNGPVRSDMGALWDFFPHSVSVLLHLLDQNPSEVSVNGASFLKKGIEDVVTMDLKFPENTFATSFGSWIHPLKKFSVIVVGEKLYAVFEDYAKDDKLKYYENAPKIIDGKVIIDDKGYQAIDIKNNKPLTEQLKHFLDCINKNKASINKGEDALRVTRILELAQKSLDKGVSVKIQGM